MKKWINKKLKFDRLSLQRINYKQFKMYLDYPI